MRNVYNNCPTCTASRKKKRVVYARSEKIDGKKEISLEMLARRIQADVWLQLTRPTKESRASTRIEFE